MKFGIIGFGNLGKAFASALTNTHCVKADDISVCDNSPEAIAVAELESYHAYSIAEINQMISHSDVVCIIVKGYVFEELSKSIDRKALEGKLVISMMAGETFEKINTLIGDVHLARAMPSLAIATNEGVIAYTELPAEVAEIFSKFGLAFEADSDGVDKLMAFASCGLGFAAYLMDAFAAAGEAMGFSPEIASQITALTFKNAGEKDNFRETVKAVATPGGATEQGIVHMDNSDVHKIVATAMQKAYERVK